MKIFTQQIDEKSEKALETCLGKNVGFIFPEVNLYTYSEGFTTSSVSVSLDHKCYLIIENDWADTPDEAIDYYFLSATLSDKPKNIKVTEHTGKGWLHHNLSSLNTGDYNIVSKVTIYEYSEVCELESVRYDAAILFEFENEIQMLLSREESISGFIEVNYKQEVIKEILNTMKPRIIQANNIKKIKTESFDRNESRIKIRY